MATACYLSNHSMQVVAGIYDGKKLRIQTNEEYELPTGTMINGVITDDDSLKEALVKLKATGINEVTVLIDSGKIIQKTEMIPKMKEKEIQPLCKLELSELTGENPDMVYDYRITRESIPDKEGMEVMFVGIETSMIENYINVYKAAGININCIDISVNAITKLCSICPELSEKNFILAIIDENDVTSYMFVDGQVIMNTRTRIFATKGTPEFVSELSTKINQLKQFKTEDKKTVELDEIFICGLDGYEDEKNVYANLEEYLEIKVSRFTNSVNVVNDSLSQSINMEKYVYPMGSLIRK